MGMQILKVQGSPSQIGNAIGQACRDLILERMGRPRPNMAEDRMWQLVRECWSATKLNYPRVASELQGVAEGAQVPLSALFLTLCEELWDLGDQGCTDLVAITPATKLGFLIVMGHNDDEEPAVTAKNVVVIQAQPDNAPPSLWVTIDGVAIMSGMNAAGLALGGNQLTPDDVRSGIPRLVQSRAILDCRDMLSAQWVCLNEQRASSYNNILGFQDGTVMQLEASAKDVGFIRPGPEGLLWHANIFIHPKMKQHEDKDPEYIPSSVSRAAQAERLLTENQGRIDPELMMELLRSHAGAPMSLCRHEQYSVTVYSVVMLPDQKGMWFTAGHPCQNEYQWVSL